MNHVVPIMIKYAYTAAIIGISLGSSYITPNFPIVIMLITALFLTLLLYYVGDLKILPRFGNKLTVTSDFIMAAIFIGLTTFIGFQWVTMSIYNITHMIARTVIVSLIIAAAEWYFHKYMQGLK